MKKLLAVLLVFLMAGCGSFPPKDTAAVENNGLATVCQRISGEKTPGENGWYELIRHTDGTADILFTDITEATRAPLAGTEAMDAPYGSLSGIFVSDGFLYYYFYGFPETMNKPEVNSALYQYDLKGNLIQSVIFDNNIRFSIDSAVISDGEKLYFCSENQGKSIIYTVNQQNLDVQKLYESNDSFVLTGGFENRLILYVKGVSNRMESVDITTFERKTLFETKFQWHMLDSSNLYNYQNHRDRLEIYSLKSEKLKTFTNFVKKDVIKNIHLPYPAVNDRYIFIHASLDSGYEEKSYIYDISTGKLTKVTSYADAPLGLCADGQIYFLVPKDKVTILLNGGFNKRTEYNYAIVTLEDYISGKTPAVYVTDKTEYR